MSYVNPADLVMKMIDAGEAKVCMSAQDTLIRAFMAGAILALSAAFAVTVTVQTTQPLAGAVLFPVGFCILYLLGYDLLYRFSMSLTHREPVKARAALERGQKPTVANSERWY